MSVEGVLVVGFGNVLRGDDGVGCVVADILRSHALLADARVLTRHQLTPELAEDVGAARLAVFVDARRDDVEPGRVQVDVVEPREPRRPSGSHAVDARDLVELSRTLYGRESPVFVVSVGAARFELGDGLSPTVAAALPRAVDAVVALVVGGNPGR